MSTKPKKTGRTKSSKSKYKKSSGSSSAAKATTSSGDGRFKLWQKVVIIALAVILAGSTLASILVSLVDSDDDSTDDESDSDDSTDEEEEEEEEVDEDELISDTIAEYDEMYEGIVADLEANLEEDPEDWASMLALERYYLTWGIYVTYYAETTADEEHAEELLETCQTYCDLYLEHDAESGAVWVDKALCYYYTEQSYYALTELQALVEVLPEYAPAWANMGLVYEYRGDDTSAIECYELAIEYDPDDEYGAKSYGEERIAEIEEELAEEEAEEALEDASEELSDSDSGISGLTTDLGLTDALTTVSTD